MADRVTISLRKEAYLSLKARKLPGESFSDAVMRIVPQKTAKALLELARHFPDMSEKEKAELETGARKARISMKEVLRKLERC